MGFTNETIADGLVGELRNGLFQATGLALQHLLGCERVLIRLQQPRAVALTYDDGPDPEITPRVLEVLDRHGVKATFFCVGRQVEKHPRIVRTLVECGHRIGSHTYAHKTLTWLSLRDAMNEVQRGRQAIESVTGVACTLFRPPHGLLAPRLLVRLWHDDYRIALWTYSLRDYANLPADHLWNRIRRRGIKQRDIVLCHDTTLAAPGLTDKLCVLATTDRNVIVTL